MKNIYENTLFLQYADPEMSYLFSDDMRFKIWRRLWVALAEAEHEMGLPVTEEQITELRRNQNNIDIEAAWKHEETLHHEVTAHIKAYGDQCPGAKGIIHLGASDSFITDNTQLIVMDRALRLVEESAVLFLATLASFAETYAGMPAPGYTSLRPAQPTTVGKRATIWMQDFLLDLGRIRDLRSNYMLRGLKGATGTQASYLMLFDGDYEKVEQLERRVLNKVGYLQAFPVTGKSYPRKFDAMIADALAGLAQSTHRFANDVAELQGMQEYEESFALTQVGSSEMPYQRNPRLCGEICGTARYAMSLATCISQAAAQQDLESAPDDRVVRMTVPPLFLATQSILNAARQVAENLTLFEETMKRHIHDELPFFATEAILIEAVKRGGDRQQLHEKLRQYSMQARYRIVSLGENNSLLEVIARDSAFHLTEDDLRRLTDPALLTGAAERQVHDFLKHQARPVLDTYSETLAAETNISV